MTAKEKFEKWFENSSAIERINHTTLESALESFYAMPFDFQLGVWLAYFRSLGYGHFHEWETRPGHCCDIIKLDTLEYFGKVKRDTFEQAFKELRKQIMK